VGAAPPLSKAKKKGGKKGGKKAVAEKLPPGTRRCLCMRLLGETLRDFVPPHPTSSARGIPGAC
jgi:hypothetical protein